MKHKEEGGRMRMRMRMSIGSQLNLRFFLRLIAIFLVLDILLLVTAAAGLVLFAEQTLVKVTAKVGDPRQLDRDAVGLLAVSGIRIQMVEGMPAGYVLPAVLQELWPEQTALGARSFEYVHDREVPLWRRLDSLRYRFERTYDDGTYAIDVDLRNLVRVLGAMFVVLFVMQFVYAVRSLFSGAMIIRRTLRPIVELAEKAQSLNTDKGPYTPEEMEALAGKLAGINAARLDTRIELDDAQDELKNVAAAINGMLDRIRDSYRSQVRFVSDASHELRSPIAAIQGYANLLDRWGKHDSQALQESIDAIKDEAANMKELIEQLLFLARGDNHAMPLQVEPFDLADLAEAVLRETKMTDTAHHFCSNLVSVSVYADAALIKQALRILMDNAIKYTPVGGEIAIAVSETDGKASLTVQDDGIGIPPAAVPRIFDRFFRADESRARATGGTGLGLSICKWIAERHGGYMEVLSRQDLGTRVSIVIPAKVRGASRPSSEE